MWKEPPVPVRKDKPELVVKSLLPHSKASFKSEKSLCCKRKSVRCWEPGDGLSALGVAEKLEISTLVL